jgi:hypothetical protein
MMLDAAMAVAQQTERFVEAVIRALADRDRHHPTLTAAPRSAASTGTIVANGSTCGPGW